MAKFTLKMLAAREQKGKVKEYEAGREYLLKLGDAENDDEWSHSLIKYISLL